MSGYDPEAFRKAIPALYPRLKRAVTVYLAGSGVDPEDIIQETFLKAYRNLDRFKGESNLYTWLYAIARNLCIDEFRKQKKYKNTADQPVEEFELASDDFSSDEEKEEILLLRKAITRLPGKFREIIIMKAIDQMSYEEISEITGINEQTLKNRMFRGKKMLAEILHKMGVEEP